MYEVRASFYQGGAMAKDLKIDVDGVILNIRCGVILRSGENVVIEISRLGRNSVLPGGRVRINEHSSVALAREIREETGFEIEKERLQYVKTMENFFNFEGTDAHEIYFLYEYDLTTEELAYFDGADNLDNQNETYFKLVKNSELETYNLLPTELFSIIRREI